MTLSRRGALRAHVRDELGLDEERRARPFQAAWTSALSFSAGAALPLLAVAVTPASARVAATVIVTLIALGLLGDLGARLGGAPRRRRPSGSSPGAPPRWRSPRASARSSAPSPERPAGSPRDHEAKYGRTTQGSRWSTRMAFVAHAA